MSLVLLFVIKCKYRKKPIFEILFERYGESGVKDYKQLERFDFKLQKLECDLDFLLICFNNYLTPKFLNFKTSLTRFNGDSSYKKYQRTLLQKEIEFKRQSIIDIRKLKGDFYNILKQRTSYLDFNHFLNNIKKKNASLISRVQKTHERKLFKLGLNLKYEKLPTEKLITNLSSTPLRHPKRSLKLRPKILF